jgi:hypothetical protein
MANTSVAFFSMKISWSMGDFEAISKKYSCQVVSRQWLSMGWSAKKRT